VYRLFIDEFGHDNINTRNDPKEQYLSLTGVVVDLDPAHLKLTDQMNDLKIKAFGTDAVVLHRREIIDKKPPPFDALTDVSISEAFTRGLLKMVNDADYTALTVLIDKKEHFEKYKVWRFQPYHYCLTAMLERYVMLLDDRGGIGDVMAEWRGKKPNMKLEKAYIHVYNNGTPNMPWNRFQLRLSSGQLKIQKKEANVAGLQLADLLANPAARDLICKKLGVEMTAPVGTQMVKILYESKYHRNWRGIVKGCGTKTLP
jgi:peroxiredoxin